MKLSTAIFPLLAAAYSASAEDCNAGEEQLEFTLFLDEDSLTENGWSLACEDAGTVWAVPLGSLQFTDPTALGYVLFDSDAPFVKEQVCLSVNDTCHFTLEDAFGDGLLFPGYFSLVYGASTIAVSEMEEEFLEKSYCVGPHCSQLPQEVAQDCDYVYLNAQADATPQENTIAITCNKEVVFQHTFAEPEEIAEFDECIPSAMCCTLTITNAVSDGSDVRKGARILATWANTVIFESDDSSEFGDASFAFGLGCPVVIPEATQEPKEPQEQPADSQPQVDALDNTTDKVSKEARRSSKGAIIAFAVIGAIVLLAILLFTVLRCTSHTNHEEQISTMAGKDMEVRSQATDIDVEPL